MSVLLVLLVFSSGCTSVYPSSTTANSTMAVSQELQALKTHIKLLAGCLTSRVKEIDAKLSQLNNTVNLVNTDVIQMQTTVNRVEQQVGSLLREKQVRKEATFSVYGLHPTDITRIHKNKGDKFVYHNAWVNHGGKYSPSTGAYTCPTTGTYFFSISVFGHDIKNGFANSLANAKLVKQGRQMVEVFLENGNTGAIHGTISNSVILGCSAGEKVWVESLHDNNHLFNWPVLNSFTGFLISMDD